MTGKVVKAERGGTFRVELSNDKIILAHLSGKMRKNDIRVVVGDSVDIEMDTVDLTRGRIIYRYKESEGH